MRRGAGNRLNSPHHRIHSALQASMLHDLGHSLRRALLAAAALLLLEGLIAHTQFGMPITPILRADLISAPALVLFVLAIIYARLLFSRLLLAAILFAANYAQYTFASFYGRFLQPSEILLTLKNSLRELTESTLLYFNAAALLAALATLLVYTGVALWLTDRPRRQWLSLIFVPAATLWSLAVGSMLPMDPAGPPDVAFISITARSAREHLLHTTSGAIPRQLAPPPTHTPVTFNILYLVGESLRADRFPPGQYGRTVTPYLHSLTLPHVTFDNVTSHGDCTGRSVPYLMVAPGQPLHLDLYKRPTLFAYAKKAGFHTSFVYANENDWAEFIDGNIDTLHRNAEVTSGTDEWTYNSDEKMIDTIAALDNAEGPQFMVVETYTSHWPYGDRYQTCATCRVYRPDNIGRPVPFSSQFRTQIINSYDNATLYFDRFMDHLIGALHKPTLIIFTSDHGESLGERGMWGHCSGAPEQFLVPLMFIATDQQVADSAGFDRLSGRANWAVSHGNLFPSILGYLGYDPRTLRNAYEPSLFELPTAVSSDRAVLISEIGSGAEPVWFAHLDPTKHLLFKDFVKPTQ